jgi:DNA polymerase-3 subunit epsilon
VEVKNLKITNTFRTFINPGTSIPFIITELTGITDYEVSSAPYFEEAADDILNFIGDKILTAHNLPFDYKFLQHELSIADLRTPPNPTLCTLKLARKLYPSLPSKSLGALTSHFRLRNKNVHRALGDATVTAKLLIRFLKELREEHGLETIDEVLKFQGKPSGSSFKMLKKTLADDIVKFPDEPGVYLFKNRKGDVIYVGKAKSLKKRIANYFTNTAGRKAKKITRQASRVSFETTNSELTALLTEATLIKQINPPLNSQLKKYSQTYFIKVKLKHKAPNLLSTQQIQFDGNDYFGPYGNRETAKRLIEIVDRTYLLRECTDKEFAKGKKCYLAEIERCAAPCVEKRADELYKEELEKAYEFLSGENQQAVNRLLNKMKEFSENQKYEHAAEVRDTVNLILNQLNRSSILAEPINAANVMIEISEGMKKDYLLLIEGKVFIKNFLPDKNDYFEQALTDYYDGTINVFNGVGEDDLERIKISLSWLVKNRNKARFYYLRDYDSKEELKLAASMRAGGKRRLNYY